VTTATGIARSFEGLNAGESVVVTVSKAGFTGVQNTITLSPGRKNNLEVRPIAGTGGPSCGGASIAAPPAAPAAVSTPVATSLSATTTTAQQGVVGTAVAVPPAVIVRDQNNTAMSGVTVVFVVVSGGGAVSPATLLTGPDGIARLTSWTLGSTAGGNSLVAKVTALPAVTFSAVASSPVSTDTQAPTITAPANVTVAATSLSGAVVTYPAPVASDNSGAVTVRCQPTRGTVFPIGTTTVTCTATDAAGNSSSATFTVTVTAPISAVQPPKITKIEAVITPATSSPAGKPVVNPPKVRVRDQNDNGMANVTVSFVVTGGNGSLSPATLATGSDGTAQVASWQLGNVPGANTMAASAGNLTALSFSVDGKLVPTTISATSNTQMSATTGAPVPQPPAVLVVDQFGTGLQGATVSFAVTEGGGVISPATVTTDGEGKARATSWTLGLAGGSNKVTATVGTLPPLEFAASGLVLNVSTPIVTVSRPELSVNVAQSAATIVAGTSQTYTVKVHNRGSGTTNSIVLRNALPADLNFVSSGATRGFICSRSGTTLSCTSGTISGGDSATIRVVMSLVNTAQSGHPIIYGATVDPENAIAESNEANNSAGAVATTAAAARLGEERLAIHGIIDVNYSTERGITTLDCSQFGESAVMVGLEATGTSVIEGLKAECSTLRSGGALNTETLKTNLAGSSLSPTERRCPSGSAVRGISGTVDNNRLTSITLVCQTVVSTGLTSGTITTKAPLIQSGSTPFSADSCTNGRPARAIKVGLSTTEAFLTWRVVGVQLICEQPAAP
jgi:adhesin/invasin